MQIEEVSNQEYKVHVINSIKKKHPDLRQASKAVTFALTYQGKLLKVILFVLLV